MMNNHQEWTEFLGNMFNNVLKEYQATKEYEFLKEKQEQLDARICEAYPDDKHPLVYDLAFEVGLDAERKAESLYRQGMSDCIFLLKELGVLA